MAKAASEGIFGESSMILSAKSLIEDIKAFISLLSLIVGSSMAFTLALK